MVRALLMVIVIPSLAVAQVEKGPPRKVETKGIVLHPAAAPSPALRYRLLPEIRDLTPGNGALVYQRAHSPELWGSVQRSGFDKLDWFDVPLDKFPVEEAKKVLAQTNVLKEIDLAARRQSCDWEMLDRLRSDGMALLLPDVQGFRSYGRLVGVRSREAIRTDKFDVAIHSLQTGFALARDVADGPTLINYLVGISIANVSAGVLEDWIQRPAAPNLYWALTELPRPMMSARKNVNAERLLVDNLFPGAREVLANPAKSADLRLEFSLGTLRQLEGIGQKPGLAEAWLALRLTGEAREFLMKNGFTRAQVDSLGLQKTIVLYLVAQNDRVYDDLAKWVTLPYWQANAGMLAVERDLQAAKKKNAESVYLPALLMPALSRVISAQTRLDRRIETLRAFEAIRLYAAQNDGRLPKSWDDLTVPTPLDPAHGRPFEYRVEQGRATLIVPGLSAAENTIHYELSMKNESTP